MENTVESWYRLIRKGPTGNRSGIITGIWFAVGSNILVNALMSIENQEYLIPGSIGLIGGVLWHLSTIKIQGIKENIERMRVQKDSEAAIKINITRILKIDNFGHKMLLQYEWGFALGFLSFFIMIIFFIMDRI